MCTHTYTQQFLCPFAPICRPACHFDATLLKKIIYFLRDHEMIITNEIDHMAALSRTNSV